MIIHIEAEIKLLQLFKCAACGTKVAGTTERHSFKHIGYNGAEAVLHYLENIRQNPKDMPVGWSHSGNGVFYCGCNR